MNKSIKYQRQKGFTLIEILVVVVIIGILMAVLLPRLNFISTKSREAGVKNNFHTFQTSAESYMREIAGKTPTESGLNSYLDTSTKFNSKNSLLKDPWGNPYKMDTKTVSNSESLIIFRSSGVDNASTSSTDVFHYEGATTDLDDKLLVIHYKNGVVKSCTKGLNDNTGNVNISGAGISLPPAAYDVPQSLRQPYESSYQYEYAIAASSSSTGSLDARTYVFSNTPLNLVINSTGGVYDQTSITEINNRPYVGFNIWYMTGDMWGVYYNTYNPPVFFNSGGINPLTWDTSFNTGGYILGITDISGQSTTPYTILGCN